jgi:hypothetical protein
MHVTTTTITTTTTDDIIMAYETILTEDLAPKMVILNEAFL